MKGLVKTMKDRIEHIQTFLDSDIASIIDISEEKKILQGLITAQNCTVILVTGLQNSDPFSLLAGFGLMNLFPKYFISPFPVECIYGDKLHLIAESADGERNIFYCADDFKTHFGNNWDNISMLQIALPAEVLRQTNLVFYSMNSGGNNWMQYAARCNGFILTLSADDGTISDNMISFCRWIDEKLCMKDCICTVLNHAEETLLVNYGLECTMQELLDENAVILTCDHDKSDEENPNAVINKAVTSVLSRKKAELTNLNYAADDILSGIGEKLQRKIIALEESLNKSENEKSKWLDAIETVRNEVIQDHYKLDCLLTEQEKLDIHEELVNFTAYLYEALPAMGEELVQCSDDPKADMGNLCGDYIEAVLESFMIAMVNELVESVLVPRAVDLFNFTQERLKVLLNDLPMNELKNSDNICVTTDFLKTLHINVGQSITKFALIIGDIVANVILLIFRKYGLGKIVGKIVTRIVSAITPNKMFVNDCIKNINQKMPPKQTADLVYENMNKSLLSLIICRLVEAYDRMVDEYISAMTVYVNVYEENAEKCRNKITAIEAVLQKLNSI